MTFCEGKHEVENGLEEESQNGKRKMLRQSSFSLGNCYRQTAPFNEYIDIVILRKKLHETPVNTHFFS
jgi:hypothetical protein